MLKLFSTSRSAVRIANSRVFSNSNVAAASKGFVRSYAQRKTPMELISEVPPIEVTSEVAKCNGGANPNLGHPVEFIRVDFHQPQTCKYCGLRYIRTHKNTNTSQLPPQQQAGQVQHHEDTPKH
eukprot:GEZU01023661.1.p2 GENE.GEZU01023661.1~~GEZU01023661.1.p2  ORF type:complete len:124 (-),score=29.02 GEZU01023661.1:317-688(-)